MNKHNYIETNNKEKLGKYFFQKGLEFALNREFGKAYEFLKECLDFITCDCQLKGWNNQIENWDKNIFNDIENNNSNHKEYFFVKAFLILYAENFKNVHIALDAIESYIAESKDDYGYYIKGKVLLKLDQHTEALEMFLSAKDIKNSSRINYVIGRTKEHFLKENGLSYVYNSLIMNSSSGCCARELKLYYKKYDIVFTNPNVTNKIWDMFINESIHPIKFWSAYSRTINEQISEDGKINKYSVDAIYKFIEYLQLNEKAFLPNETVNDDDYDYRYDTNYDDTPDWDNEFYNDSLDMDQQSPEWWDSI